MSLKPCLGPLAFALATGVAAFISGPDLTGATFAAAFVDGVTWLSCGGALCSAAGVGALGAAMGSILDAVAAFGAEAAAAAAAGGFTAEGAVFLTASTPFA